MFDIYKANLVRIIKNILFIPGCLIDLVVTFMISRGIESFPFLTNADPVERMFFISAAIIPFFTVFVPTFTNSEYHDGAIRNKIVAGKTQKQIYLSHLFAEMTAAVIMWVFYIIGGIAGGSRLDGSYMMKNIVLLFAIFSFISVMLAFSFRVRKLVALVIFAACIFTASFNSIMFGNLLLMLTKGTVQYVASLFYNVSALGQWFACTNYVDEVANPGNHIQILISIIIIVLTTIIGTFRINKRDIV